MLHGTLNPCLRGAIWGAQNLTKLKNLPMKHPLEWFCPKASTDLSTAFVDKFQDAWLGICQV